MVHTLELLLFEFGRRSWVFGSLTLWYLWEIYARNLYFGFWWRLIDMWPPLQVVTTDIPEQVCIRYKRQDRKNKKCHEYNIFWPVNTKSEICVVSLWSHIGGWHSVWYPHKAWHICASYAPGPQILHICVLGTVNIYFQTVPSTRFSSYHLLVPMNLRLKNN